MIVNYAAQNPYSPSFIKASQPLSSESLNSSANPMPTNNRTILEPNVIRRPLNNVHPDYLKQVYMPVKNSSSNGSLTESFIRARASMSPAYVHNEILTRYEMISMAPLKLVQIKKSIDKVA